MSLDLTWGLLIIGVGISAALYGISTAQTFYYYRTYGNDPLSTRILTGTVWLLNTVHLILATHIPWYYLVDGAGGTNDSRIVWSWPTSLIVTVLISLPVYAFYARRIRILGGRLWLCITVLVLGFTHFTLGLAFSIKLLLNNDVMALASPVNRGLLYSAFVVGTTTDVGIALIMCWLLWQSRTGYAKTDGVVSMIMLYTINTGTLIALCVVASLVSGLVAKSTQFELFFLFLLPDLYANSYLGSLNNRKSIRAQLNHRTVVSSGPSLALGDLRSPLTPDMVVHLDSTFEFHKTELDMSSGDAEQRAEV